MSLASLHNSVWVTGGSLMARRRHRSYTPMGHRNWLLREHGGMPGWAIIASITVVVVMLTYAALNAA